MGLLLQGRPLDASQIFSGLNNFGAAAAVARRDGSVLRSSSFRAIYCQQGGRLLPGAEAVWGVSAAKPFE